MKELRIDKTILDIINQIFEIEKKVSQLQESNSLSRNINRLKEIIGNDLVKLSNDEKFKLSYHNPIGEPYNETRTDCEASIAGIGTEDLVITEVIKPIIRFVKDDMNIIVQKAIVVVESKNRS